VLEYFLCDVGEQFAKNERGAGGILGGEQRRGIRGAERCAFGTQGGEILVVVHGRATQNYAAAPVAGSTAN
jgi:hypothetical protein